MSGKWAATNIAGCYRCAPKHFKVSLLIADDLVRLTSSSHRAAFTDKMRNTTSKFKAMVLCQVDFPLGVGWVSFCPKVKLIQLLCFPLSHWLYWLPLTSALQTSSCCSAQHKQQNRVVFFDRSTCQWLCCHPSIPSILRLRLCVIFPSCSYNILTAYSPLHLNSVGIGGETRTKVKRIVKV